MRALRCRTWWYPKLLEEDTATANSSSFIWEMYRLSSRYKDLSHANTLLNHIQHNKWLVTKNGLYLSLKSYCQRSNVDLLSIIPRTFYLVANNDFSSNKATEDDLSEFIQYNSEMQSITNEPSFRQGKVQNNIEDAGILHAAPSDMAITNQAEPEQKNSIVWIMKPATNTNRGFGIQLINGMDNVIRAVNKVSSADCGSNEPSNESFPSRSKDKKIGNKQTSTDSKDVSQSKLSREAKRLGSQHGWIVQLYLDRPLLVSGRKFDIRCYVLVTVDRWKGMKGYFFKDSYVRTSSKRYSLNNIADREAHLTNDAVQKHSKSYGKYEEGNKLDMLELQALIVKDYPQSDPNIIAKKIFPAIKSMCKLSLMAVEGQFTKTNINKSFELFGYDYMIDDQFRPILIEVNTNPCLELVCPLLEDIITNLINNTITLAVDPVYPPPPSGQRSKSCDDAVSKIESEEMRYEPLFP